MNIFRLAGDLLHLSAIIILLVKLLQTRSCVGISGKSQLLLLIVYITRYLDLFTTFISVYNSTFKIIFICGSLIAVLLIFVIFRSTYDRDQDSFRIDILVLPSAILALLINYEFIVLEVLWTFSIYLEAVAILPQLMLIKKVGQAESTAIYYLTAMGSYRILYLLNWTYRYLFEVHYDLIVVFGGVVQTILYCIFFCWYTEKKKELSDDVSEKKVGLDSMANIEWIKPDMSIVKSCDKLDNIDPKTIAEDDLEAGDCSHSLLNVVASPILSDIERFNKHQNIQQANNLLLATLDDQ